MAWEISNFDHREWLENTKWDPETREYLAYLKTEVQNSEKFKFADALENLTPDKKEKLASILEETFWPIIEQYNLKVA